MDLIDLDLVAAAAAIADGSVRPDELLEAHLACLLETDALNAWWTVDLEGARASAHRATLETAAGRRRGALHGIPVGVKDLIDTAGLRTTYGSPRFAAHVPTQDAAVVAGLRAAGAVIVGKQATHEFAFGGRTDSAYFGPTRNPHDHDRIPGGSSGGGAAAIAVGAGLLAIGTDTAGSVRIPAALSGCVGFKPSRGWCSLTGVHPLSPALDHLGLMTRTVADARLAFGAMTGSRARSMTPKRPGSVGVLVGRVRELLDVEVADAYEGFVEGLRGQGVTLVEIDDPYVDERVSANLTLIRAQAEQIHHAAFAADPSSYGSDLAELLAMGPVGDAQVAAAAAVARRSAQWLHETVAQVSVLIGPTEPIVAPPIGEMIHDLGGGAYPIELLLTRLTSIANVAGLPALSFPITANALPVGLQVMGASDAAVLSMAQWLGELA